jgi:putative Mn2+ efflux pump MntP
MHIISICLIALGLAMDAFAVSISCGMHFGRVRFTNALIIALFFGSFQAFMPVIGWYCGIYIEQYVSAVDHWIAFGLLCLVGGRMIYEAFRKSDKRRTFDPRKISVLFLLAIVTSIDAFAVGLSLALLQMSIFIPVIIIGSVTLMLSLGGVYLGNRIGAVLGKKVEVLGGLILIGIGIKTLIDHLA